MTAAAPTAPRPAHDRPLTRTEREFLEQLRFRSGAPDGSFIFSLRKKRWGLIVRTAMGTHEVHPRFSKNERTLDLLENAGLIEIGPLQKLPEPFAPGGNGHPITLAQLGRDAIG